MRRFICLSMLSSLAIGIASYVINAHSSEPTERINRPTKSSDEPVNQSETHGLLRQEWEQTGFLDQPSHMSPERTDGGIQ